jgi:hypothetical protein
MPFPVFRTGMFGFSSGESTAGPVARRIAEDEETRLRLKYDIWYHSAARQKGAHVWVDGREMLMLASNEYLGLSEHPKVIAAAKAALDEWGRSPTVHALPRRRGYHAPLRKSSPPSSAARPAMRARRVSFLHVLPRHLCEEGRPHPREPQRPFVPLERHRPSGRDTSVFPQRRGGLRIRRRLGERPAQARGDGGRVFDGGPRLRPARDPRRRKEARDLHDSGRRARPWRDGPRRARNGGFLQPRGKGGSHLRESFQEPFLHGGFVAGSRASIEFHRTSTPSRRSSARR